MTTDRVAIVTGSSRGIGLAIAEALVDRGDRVCITGRNAESLAEAAAGLGGGKAAGNGRVIAVAGKAHDPEHQDDVVTKCMASFGRVDFLVNNVGTNPVFGPMIDLDADVLRKIFDVNVMSAFGWTQRVHRAWMASHGGAVVNVSSVASLRPAPGLGAYGMSKAALSYLTAQLAVELAPDVRVNAVAPAVVKTKFATALYEGREAEVAATYPAGRLGVPEDVAGAVSFLLSDDASWITGQTIVLDGGSTLVGSLA
jgi:NAD(P)-dependent dehydrogenase (short-subunit alcohol dehydrogenase family)